LYDVVVLGNANSTACYEITDINAPENTNDLPAVFGVENGCGDTLRCAQQ
jgi:hypothetical protein